MSEWNFSLKTFLLVNLNYLNLILDKIYMIFNIRQKWSNSQSIRFWGSIGESNSKHIPGCCIGNYLALNILIISRPSLVIMSCGHFLISTIVSFLLHMQLKVIINKCQKYRNLRKLRFKNIALYVCKSVLKL